jgi:hypothetical protein
VYPTRFEAVSFGSIGPLLSLGRGRFRLIEEGIFGFQ